MYKQFKLYIEIILTIWLSPAVLSSATTLSHYLYGVPRKLAIKLPEMSITARIRPGIESIIGHS